MKSSRWLPLSIVARRLGVSFDTARWWIRSNKLRARLVSGRWWVLESELEAFERGLPRDQGAA